MEKKEDGGSKTFSSSDPDGAGFVRWRVAFYVAGNTNEALINLLMLLDGYFVFINEGREERVTTRIIFWFSSSPRSTPLPTLVHPTCIYEGV